MSTPEMGLSQGMVPEQSPAEVQVYHNEVWQAHKEQAGNQVVERMAARILESPDTAKMIAVVGEPASMKGTLLGQAAQQLKEEPEITEALDTVNKSLAYHYISTALLIKTGIEQGWIQADFGGAVSPEAARYTASRVNEALKNAERALPQEAPEAIHVFLEELVADEELDLGMSAMKRYSGNEDATIIFVVSHPAIQERAYKQRRALWEGSKDPKRMLRAHKTVFDIAPDAARLTMGSSGSIERMVERRNLQMYEAWQEGKLLLPEGPNKVPWEVLRSNDPRELTGDALREFFTHLIEFTEGNMRTNPIRPYLQYGYYEYLSEEWGITANTVILPPQVIEDVIYAYPGFLAEHALPVKTFLESTASQASQPEGEVFIAEPPII